MRKWHTIFLMVLMSCGQQPGSVKTEYYIEQDKDTDKSYDSTVDEEKNDGSTATTPDPKALALNFKDTGGADANGIIKVEVEIKNADDKSTWSASFSSKADLSDPTLIDEDLTVDTTFVDWDVSNLGAGTFYLFAEIKVAGKLTRFKATNPVILDETGTPTNGRPSISLDFPLGENVFVAGTPQNIRWTAADPDNDAISFKVEYSADGGANWTMIADNVAEKTYAWDAAGLTQGITYKVKVTAKDAKGALNTATSTKNFGVATTPMTFAAGFGAMIALRCANCHAAGRPNQGTFRSDDFDLANIGVSDKMNNIKTRIENNTMPTAGGLLAPDKAILTMWLWGGGQ